MGASSTPEPIDTVNHVESVDLATFDLFDAQIQQEPTKYYAAMRSRAPVFQVPNSRMFIVATHELISTVLRDWETYSSRFGSPGTSSGSVEEAELAALRTRRKAFPAVPTMLTADPPEHSRYRRLVTTAFTPRAVLALEPDIRRIVGELIDAITPDETFDFVSKFAVPLPVAAIAQALGVPADRGEDFKRWSDCTIAPIGARLSLEDRLAAEEGVIDFQHYFADQIEQRKQASANGGAADDLVTRLIRARIDDGEVDDRGQPIDPRPLDTPEILSILQQLLVAGNETTTKLLTEAIRLLGEHPREWQMIRDDASLIPSVVEEALRLSTPTQGMFRRVRRPTELAGVSLEKGDMMILMYASANRDESVFVASDASESPGEFCPHRAALNEHLAFGKGLHFCVGAALSRLEVRVALEELSRRFETISLAETNTYTYHPSFLLRGLISLDLAVS